MESEDHSNLDFMRTAQVFFHCGKAPSVSNTKLALTNTLHTHHAEAVNYSFCKADISGQLKLFLELFKAHIKMSCGFLKVSLFIYLFDCLFHLEVQCGSPRFPRQN